ncbi:hypothetical protein QQX13_12125 [Demequina sp. SYSU T00068]|uniref:hypothetical protein n=1 Tax=Demequina lignilytica TaxID=3051663 RepID=UPI0026249930|nr:hypothetical protein [Demequina sp. SYSU T00068]MDN4491581.1 hypothetical protein [Demequina sp. SYSU T00068]
MMSDEPTSAPRYACACEALYQGAFPPRWCDTHTPLSVQRVRPDDPPPDVPALPNLADLLVVIETLHRYHDQPAPMRFDPDMMRVAWTHLIMLALRADTPTEALERIWRSRDRVIMAAAIGRLSLDRRRELAHHRSSDVRWAVAHVSSEPEILASLADDPDPYVRSGVSFIANSRDSRKHRPALIRQAALTSTVQTMWERLGVHPDNVAAQTELRAMAWWNLAWGTPEMDAILEKYPNPDLHDADEPPRSTLF